MLKIYLTVISLCLLSCAQESLPADYIYSVDVKQQICDQYKIDKDNIKFHFEKTIPWDQCPIIYGFEEKDVGHVMNYIRRVKTKVGKCNAIN